MSGSWLADLGATEPADIATTWRHRSAADNEVGNPLRRVDLNVMSGAIEQVQVTVGEHRGEVARHPRVEVAIAGAENHPYRPGERAHVADPPSAGRHRGEQVVVKPPERRAGRQGLLVQLRDHLFPDGGVG